MDLSIVIVNYNTKDLTINCVDSILKSRPQMDYEIIIVDNASTDGSVELFEKIRGSKVRIISHKKNLGFAKANNSAIRKSIGQFTLLLNSDTLVTRGSIDGLLEFAKKTAATGLVGPKLLNADGSVQASVLRLPTVKRAIQQYWFNQGKILDKYIPSANKPVEVEALVAAAVLITPRAKHDVGLLNEQYFMYFEDLDYCRKVGQAGLKIYYHPDFEVYHLHGASGRNISAPQDQWRRLIPSSKIYHGLLKHYLIFLIMWSGQKLQGLQKD